jgi:hypothetical protein
MENRNLKNASRRSSGSSKTSLGRVSCNCCCHLSFDIC